MTDTLELETPAETLTRREAPGKSTWDPKTRTVTVKASGFADVRRYDFVERLSSAPADWDFSRVASEGGVPFLASHNSYDLSAKLGKVLSAEVRKDGVFAVVKLSETPAADALIRDLETGIGCAVSIGYRVSKWELDRSGELPVRTAKAVHLLEISAVSVGADPTASVRSLEIPMNEHVPEATAETERTRADTILSLGTQANMDTRFIQKHIKAGTTADAFRGLVLDQIIAKQGTLQARSHDDGCSRGDTDRVQLMGEALFARINPRHELSAEARQFRGMPLAEMARACLDAKGELTRGMTQGQLIERALHSTSDFPELLANTTGRSLRSAYDAAPAVLKQICRQSTAQNFKAKHALVFGEAPKLEKVNDSGEFKRGTFSEAKESYAIRTYGKVFGITRQALINDDLSAFSTIPRKLAQAASAFEANFLADLIEGNPTMGDAKALFHADHKNLGTAAALSVAALSAAKVAMRRQKGLTDELISVEPKFLIVPPELESTAEQLLASIAAAKTSDVNVFAGKLTLLVEPRLEDALAWYLAADPAVIDTIEYAYLEGEEGPQLFNREGFDVDGVEFKVRLDFGAGTIDFRGLYKNPGA